MVSRRASPPPPPPPPPCPNDAPAWSASAFDVDEVESLLDDTAEQGSIDDDRAEVARLRKALDAERAAFEKEKAEHAVRSRQLKQARAELDQKVAREVEARLASARAAFAREKAALQERVAREVDALREQIDSGSKQLSLKEGRDDRHGRDDRDDRRKPSPLARMLRRRRLG